MAASPATEKGSLPTEGSWVHSRTRSSSESRLRGGPRARSVPHLMLGVLLVIACAGGFALVSLNLGQRQPVLALARPVTVGHVLTPADLQQVSIAADAGVSVMAASRASEAVGATMAVSLPAGSLLTRGVLGAAAVPQAGQAIAAFALKAGQFPPEVAAGAHVLVVLVPATAGAAGSPGAPGAGSVWPATVTGVAANPNLAVTVVSVQLSESDARQVAAVPSGSLSVVMVSGGGQ